MVHIGGSTCPKANYILLKGVIYEFLVKTTGDEKC